MTGIQLRVIICFVETKAMSCHPHLGQFSGLQCPSDELRSLNIKIASVIEVAAPWNVYCVCNLLLGWCWRNFFVMRQIFLQAFHTKNKDAWTKANKILKNVALPSDFYCMCGMPLGRCCWIFTVMRQQTFVLQAFLWQNWHLTMFWNFFLYFFNLPYTTAAILIKLGKKAKF